MKNPKINIPFYVSTNDKHLECLKVFIHTFNYFLPQQELRILGYDYPKYKLPSNCKFISMGIQGSINEWSTDLRNYFLTLKDSHFIYGTEDTFIHKHPKIDFINYLVKLSKKDSSIGRINLVDGTEGENCDLPNSVHYNVNLVNSYEKNEHSWGNWKLYQQNLNLHNCSITTQFSIWNKDFFLKYLVDNLDPWQFEGQSFKVSEDDNYKVLMVDDNFPISKKEGYSLGTWTNKDYWLSLLDDKTKQELFG